MMSIRLQNIAFFFVNELSYHINTIGTRTKLRAGLCDFVTTQNTLSKYTLSGNKISKNVSENDKMTQAFNSFEKIRTIKG